MLSEFVYIFMIYYFYMFLVEKVQNEIYFQVINQTNYILFRLNI